MTDEAKREQTDVNDSGTKASADARLTQACSGPVRFEVVTRDGIKSPMKFETAAQAAAQAKAWFPDQEQDPDRTGKGYDIQVVGGDK